MRGRLSAGAIVAALLAVAIPGTALGAAAKPWPPAQKGTLFVHYGEEHINDDDGGTLLPRVVRESIRYRPALVTMSGDKADDGQNEQFEMWAEVMAAYDRAGIPWFAGVGNHDRTAPPGTPGGLPENAPFFDTYKQFFADRPYPMGDEAGYGGGISPSTRPAGDPAGTSTHYFVDVGKGVRWIFIDNSCWSIIGCDPHQNPSAQNQGETQFEFLERVAGEADQQGRLAFVVMHMPTRDPRDQSYADPISTMHTMGKGPLGTLDNTTFEQTAAAAGVDGVFVGHIKGQFLYEGEGEVPYFIDGGAGGELYTTGPVGVDHGYWHGFRLINVRKGRFTTDVVPIFVPKGITIEGPRSIKPGEVATFAAFGRQPVFNDPAKVEALELRDPDPIAPGSEGALAWIGDVAPWVGPPLAVLALIALSGAHGRRRRFAVPAVVVIGAIGFAGVSAAQQSEPTETPVESLPNPARMWTTSDRKVLKPVKSATDDPRRNKRTQTEDGRFRAVCPGKAKLTIASGFATATYTVRVKGGNSVAPRCRR